MAIWLMVDGSRVDPESAESDRVVFRLCMPAREIRLLSGYARPSDVLGSNDDRRLGVAVGGLNWRHGDAVLETPIDSPAFIDGFHPLESYPAEARPFRWTNGNAGLPPGLLPNWEGETWLDIPLPHGSGSPVQARLTPEAALLGAFENFGEKCEFAVVQRYYGVELPLTLLRWAGTTYEKLLLGLCRRFDGLGQPATTEVVWDETDYRLRTPYLNFHTNADAIRDAAGIAEIWRHGCPLLRLLRRKLLTDITGARRIFVYSTDDPAFGPAKIFPLFQALRAIGPASLLCVTPTRPGNTSGDAEQLADGLYAGNLDRFMIPGGPADDWLALCSNTIALHCG